MTEKPAPEYPKQISVRGEQWTVYSADQEAELLSALAPRFRAKFVLTEITKTSRGVSVATFAAAHDPNAANTGGIGAPVVAQRPNAPNPKGSIALEMAPDAAASLALGAAFYLVSA